MTAGKLKETTGLYPHQWVDYQTLVGGKNNVPGVKGCGTKRATTILTHSLTLDGFFSNPVPSATGASQDLCDWMIQNKGKIQFWKKLHTLNRAVEINLPSINKQIDAFWTNQ